MIMDMDDVAKKIIIYPSKKPGCLLLLLLDEENNRRIPLVVEEEVVTALGDSLEGTCLLMKIFLSIVKIFIKFL